MRPSQRKSFKILPPATPGSQAMCVSVRRMRLPDQSWPSAKTTVWLQNLPALWTHLATVTDLWGLHRSWPARRWSLHRGLLCALEEEERDAVAMLVFLQSGQGQNRLFMSNFVLPSPARTCVANGEATAGTLATAPAWSWVERRLWPLTPKPYLLPFSSSLSLISPVLWRRTALNF
jgi:hypothetical protein